MLIFLYLNHYIFYSHFSAHLIGFFSNSRGCVCLCVFTYSVLNYFIDFLLLFVAKLDLYSDLIVFGIEASKCTSFAAELRCYLALQVLLQLFEHPTHSVEPCDMLQLICDRQGKRNHRHTGN